MKKILVVVAFCIGCEAMVQAQTYNIKNLIGRWESAEGGGIEMIDSSRVFIVYGNDKKQISSYQADFSKSPAWFDFVISDSTEKISLKSLLLFVNDEMIQWQLFEDERPGNFSSQKGEMVYLRRKK